MKRSPTEQELVYEAITHPSTMSTKRSDSIDLMGVELGVWEGSYQNQTQRWLRWWDNEGNLLRTGSEQARLERLHTEQERQRADRACANPTGCYSPTAGNGFNCRASGSGVVAVGGKSAIASCSSLGKVFNRAISRSSNSVIATTFLN